MLGVVGQESSIEINKITRSLIEKITDFEREILPQYFERKDFAYHINDLVDLDTFNIKAINAILSSRSFQITGQDNKEGKSGRISEGNSTISYLAYDRNVKEYAIVQVLKSECSTEFSSKWIEALINLKHRNIVRTYDHSLNTFPRFIIKEYIHGTSLDQAIDKAGKRPVSQVAWWLHQLADVLLYLQQKRIVHYNVRPSKIFIDDEWKIVMSPFDLSLLEETDGRISLNRYLSICKYISPESLKTLAVDSFYERIEFGVSASKNGDKWNDSADLQFSLGAIAYFAVTGVELFPGRSVYDVLKERTQFDSDEDYREQKLGLMEKCAGVSDGISNDKFLPVVRKLLSVNPADRYPSLADLLHKIRPLLQNDVYKGNELQDSYRRALANNCELIRDFYAALFEKSEISRKMFGTDAKDNTIKIRRQQAILQMIIDILIIDDDDNDRENEIRSKILASNHHKDLNKEAYEVFLDTLIGVILESDPCSSENPELQRSWNAVKVKFLSMVGGRR
jgi:serine/threonine protein kinase